MTNALARNLPDNEFRAPHGESPLNYNHSFALRNVAHLSCPAHCMPLARAAIERVLSRAC